MVDQRAFAGCVVLSLFALCGCPERSRAANETKTHYYVSAQSGDDHADGTRERPWKTIEHAADAVRPGDTVLLLPGVYRAKWFAFKPAGLDVGQRTEFKCADSDNAHGRVVLTGPDDEVPNFSLATNTRIEGLWIGGVVLEHAEEGPSGQINQPGLEIVDCVFWSQKRAAKRGRSFQLLCGNTARNVLFRNNLLVHMGADWLDHPIYISGGPPPTTQDCRFIGNVFLNGGGCPLHCWHKPANITIVGNFTSGHEFSMVAQGQGHIVHHNIFWKPRGKSDRPDWNWNALLPNDLVRFDHNILGSDHPIREGGKPQHPPVHNYSLAGLRGTQVQLIPVPASFSGRIPLIGQTSRDIELAIGRIDAYLSTRTPEEIAEDTSRLFRRNLEILRLDYKPVREDLASRPAVEPIERCECSSCKPKNNR